jgi:hydrogenase expression/formation protein HypE
VKPGKVPPKLLEALVYSHLGVQRPEVLVRPRVGEDCTVIDFGEWVAVITTDPVTGVVERLGRYAVHVACNDLATTGAEPVAILMTLLLVEGTTEDDLRMIMRDADETASALGVEIAGGHTEVTGGIDHTIAVATAVGRAPKGSVLSVRGARPGDALLLTKGAAIEGTAILATDLAARLQGRVDNSILARAREFIDRISVVPEGSIAARAGASAMHDVTEGGVLTGSWELAEAAGIGVELWADKVPIYPETKAICQALEIDPLALISSGAMLITTPEKASVVTALEDAGITVEQIGIMTPRQRVVLRGGTQSTLVPPERDELWRLLESSSRGQL